MKRIAHMLVFLLILAQFFPIFAQASAPSNPEVIEQAAESVLMLEMYDVDVNLIGTGSGFIAFNSRTMVTRYHMVEDAAWILATDSRGEKYMVKDVLAVDGRHDIAICEFLTETGLQPLEIRTGDELKPGDSVFAVDKAMDIAGSISCGSIYASSEDEIQFAADVSHDGNGGVLLDDCGCVAGVIGSVFDGINNLELAVPAVAVEKLYREQSDEAVAAAEPGESLRIVMQPQDTEVPMGENARVSVHAVGDGLVYTWYASDVGDNDVYYQSSVLTGNTYSVQMDEVRNGRKVYCIITDAYGNSMTTDTVTLSCLEGLKIKRQPQDASAAMGENIRIFVHALGEGLRYTWYASDVGDQDVYYQSYVLTGDTYCVQMDEVRNGRKVYCVITDAYGNSIVTDTVTLTGIDGLQIIRQPRDAAVRMGENARTSVHAAGEGLTYTWFASDVGDDDVYYQSLVLTDNTYIVQMDEVRNGRKVYCVITDIHGNKATTDIAVLSALNG